jgi:hypothetical protein
LLVTWIVIVFSKRYFGSVAVDVGADVREVSADRKPG